MANNLWVGAVRTGTAAARPTIPDAPDDTFQFYYATDTGALSIGVAGGSGWLPQGVTAQGAPTDKTDSATLTIAELLTGIITSTKASAVTLTLPTGALTDAGDGALGIGQSFDWSVINLGSVDGAVTMAPAATGHTYVGSTTVAISTSAVFRTRKTAAETYITYRVS